MKKIAAILTAITMLASSSMAASAILERSYDINNKDYTERVDGLGEYIYREQDLLDYFNSTYNKYMALQLGNDNFEHSPYKHIYGKSYEGFQIEEGNDEYRTFKKGFMLLTEHNFYNDDRRYQNNDEIMAKYTVDEINEFLKSEGLGSHIEEIEDKEFSTNKKLRGTSYQMCYEDTSTENIIDTFLAMNKKYGAEAQVIYLATSEAYYNEDEPAQTTAPVTTEPVTTTIVTTAPNTTEPASTTVTTAENKPQTTAPTETPKVIFGDVNGDNSINVSDCVFIAKNIAKGKGADLPDSADYNKDGRKNVLDASALSRDIAENKLN